MSEMLPKRVIPCLDVCGDRVVKGTGFVNMRDAGNPVELARRYEAEGADELVFLDIYATAEGRGTMVEVAKRVAGEVFIPFTVGGGVRSEDDVQALLDAGADKVAINSAALAKPELLNRLAVRFGRQCIVLAIDAKYNRANADWDVYAAGGRSATGRTVTTWAKEGLQRGAGEILLTSIDRDGTQSGYDLGLLKAVTSEVNVPVIASGGAGRLEDYDRALRDGGAEAVLAASQFHDKQITIGDVKTYLGNRGMAVRPLSDPGERLEDKEISERPKVAVYDYGVGNTYSVQKALERAGAEVIVSGDFDEVEYSDALVLPGVGTFRAAMLYGGELERTVRRKVLLGEPVLGICLGEQLLFDGSEEDGWTAGLGQLSGKVKEVETDIRPNIGWRQVAISWPDRLLRGLRSDDYFYHLHQYAAAPDDPDIIAGSTRLPTAADSAYSVPSVVARENLYGVQFHPEKSGTAGLRLLRNFVEISANAQAEL